MSSVAGQTRIAHASLDCAVLTLHVSCLAARLSVRLSCPVVSRSSGPNAEVGDGLTALSKSNAKLDRMLAKIGTKADTPDFRDRMHQEQTTSTQQVKSIMILLKAMNRDPQYSGSTVLQRMSVQFDREFKRFQALNNQMDQKQVKVIDAVKSARKQSMGGGSGAGGQYDEEDPLTTRPQPTYDDAYNGYNQQQQQQQQVSAAELDIQFIEYDVEELEKRQREIGQIEQDVLEVSEMYKDLQLMVNEQQENIDSIDGSITQAKEKTEAAHKELLEAEEYQKKSRKKKCCMLFIMLAVIAAIVIIVEVAK
jgi:syntaxin 7